MKKRSKYQKHCIRKQKKIKKKQLRKAARNRKNRTLHNRCLQKKRNNDKRKRIMKTFYKIEIEKSKAVVYIEKDFGIEKEDGIDDFINIACETIDFKAQKLELILDNCKRVWPSGITLFCSLMQWIELAKKRELISISSSTPKDERVESYLQYSGFYNYVRRMSTKIESNYYKDKEIVKLRREVNYEDLNERESEIVSLLEKYSRLSSNDIERFDNVVVTEILNNLTEHGVNSKDKGYWIIAQYHETHKIISICLADNGIGFRHTLSTGADAAKVVAKIKGDKDGEYIKYALENNVSGANENTKVIRKNILGKEYSQGSERGRGLRLIRECCKDMKVSLTIISHYGYVFLNEEGEYTRCGTQDKRVFAGTLYQLNIKVRESNEY